MFFISIAFAAIAGLCSGFRRWWEASLIASGIGVPLATSVFASMSVNAPFIAGRLPWVLITFFQVFLCASIVWMAAAGTRFSATWLWVEFKL